MMGGTSTGGFQERPKMPEQDPVKAILHVHAELAGHSVLKAPTHPAVSPGALRPEDVFRELAVILIRNGVEPAGLLEAVREAIAEAGG